jgi:hypothetical protein
MKRLRIFLLAGVVTCGVPRAIGQTRLDLKTQGQNVDFSRASFTKPVKTGLTLPPSCEPGELYFLTDAPAGQNLYACTSADAWSLQASGGSPPDAMVASQLGDFLVERTSPTTLSVNSSCSTVTPCLYRFGGTVSTVTAPAEASLTQGSGTGTAYFYLSPRGELTVGYTDGLTVSCTSGCQAQSSVSSFPADSIPLYRWRATSPGTWDAAGTDVRAFVGRETLLPGIGLLQLQDSTTGAMVMEIDPSLVGTQAPTPATSTALCSRGQWSMDADYLYICVGPSTWKRAPVSTWE